MYRLSQSLPYNLHRLGLRLGALFTRRIAEYELTLPMYQVLASLSEQPDQTLGELAVATSTLLPTASRLIGSLITRGLVMRERLPEDERYVRINLSPAGHALAGKLLERAEHYEEVVADDLSMDEVGHLKELLRRFYASLDTLEAELDAEKTGGN